MLARIRGENHVYESADDMFIDQEDDQVDGEYDGAIERSEELAEERPDIRVEHPSPVFYTPLSEDTVIKKE